MSSSLISKFSELLAWDGSSPTRPDGSTYRHPDGDDWFQVMAEVEALENDSLSHRYKSLTNAESGTLVPGTAVYLFSASSVKKTAPASSLATAYCLGLVAASNGAGILTTAAGSIQCNGEVTLTTAQWDAIAGTTGGLTAGTVYYASATAGALTSTLPAATGNFDTTVGIALSSTTLLLRQSTNTLAHA
jgi:hypothetical protein